VPYKDGSKFRVFENFSFGIVPFRAGFVGDCINPVKMYEYLAHGLPVLATPIRECIAAAPVVRCARTPDEWCAAVRDFVVAPRDGSGIRMDFARSNTWEIRAQTLLDVLTARGALDVRSPAP
jgi:hypothetical protein